MLKEGDAAPGFTLADQDGALQSLSALVGGEPLILYFYPADFTPVCTAEACSFRDIHEELRDAGMKVVGISPQSVSSHKRFRDSHRLPFTLLSDASKKAIRAYGVDGPFGFGVRRVTYLVDANQVIRRRVVSDLSVAPHRRLLDELLAG